MVKCLKKVNFDLIIGLIDPMDKNMFIFWPQLIFSMQHLDIFGKIGTQCHKQRGKIVLFVSLGPSM